MNNRTALILTVIFFGFNQVFGQNFNECKVDFFLLESQESFSTDDNGREYVLISDNVPDYEIKKKPTMTLEQIKAELSEKLKDNKEYNKNNPKVKDSLVEYYSEMAHNVGVNIIWWEKLREATTEELKEYNKRLKAYDKQAKMGFIPNGAIPDPKNQSSGYGRYWDATITRPEVIDENTHLHNNILYQRKQKKIRDDLPLFWIQPKDSGFVFQYNRETREYHFPIGCNPVFDFTPYKNSSFILKNEKQGNYSSMWQLLLFHVDNKYKLAMYNFKFNQGQYSPTKDYSIDIFYDKKKISKIQEFLTSLKSKELVIQSDGEEFINPTISDISFNLKVLRISFTSDGKSYTKEFEGFPDPNYSYDSGWPDRRAKQLYNFPIYYTDCYNKKLVDFNNLTLRSDYINDPALKKQLFNALTSSPDWLNYSIEKVILTNQSQWAIVTNKYTSLKESRFILADVYVKSTKTGKCYLQKEVYFSQKLDPIGEYVYSIFVSVPQTLEPYPCNLK
jgi:hypothetical protein